MKTMKRMIQVLLATSPLAVPVGLAQYSVANDGVVISVENPEPKPKYEEPQEVKRCRQIWTNAHVRTENRGETNLWQCIVVCRPTTPDQVEACKQAILECGWKLPSPKAPTTTPLPPHPQTHSESYYKDNRILWFTWSDEGVRLRVVRNSKQ
jgi:hypothetical protein